jgi:hypothetical protein
MKQYAIALTLGPFKLGTKRGLEGQTRVQRQGDLGITILLFSLRCHPFL